jgi:hypothetical protein
MVLYLCVLIVFSFYRESLKLIPTMNPFLRWFCHILPDDLLLEINGHGGTEGNNLNPQENLQLQVGFMRYQDTRVAEPVFESFTLMEGTARLSADFYKVWGRFSLLLETLRNRFISQTTGLLSSQLSCLIRRLSVGPKLFLLHGHVKQ